MKRCSTAIAFAAIFVFAGVVLLHLQHPKCSKIQNKRPKASLSVDVGALQEEQLVAIQQQISKREYYISHRNGLAQSPNRQQNLRAVYQPGKLKIQQRASVSDQEDHFNLELKTEGVYADNVLLRTPKSDGIVQSDRNKLRIDHHAFIEEYINSEAGIRQNFIIEKAPANTKKLGVELSVYGFDVKDNTNNTLTFSQPDLKSQNHTVLHYDDLKCWDSNGKVLASTLKYTGERIRIEVNVSDAAFPVTIDPIITNGTPSNANKLIEINQTSAWTGYSVSSAGDVNGDGYSEIIVGSPKYDDGEYNEGAAFLFPGTANGISLAGLILQSNQASAQSGTSVASAGDINKDGYSDVLIGAPYYDKGETDEGVVFVHLGGSGGISTTPAYTLEANQAGAFYGISVALAGDVNKDGYSDILAGAHQYSNGQTKEGAAFLYYGSVSGPGSATVLECDQVNAMMGYSVASAGDINGDGYSDVISGARLYGNGQLYEGAIFVYLGGASGVQTPPQKIESNQVDARMGHSVATAGDVNGDGYSDVIVGSYLYDSGSANEGVAFIYHGGGTGLNPAPAVTLQRDQTEAWFGWSVAPAGDVNGDGYADVAVGAIHYDNGHNNEGAAFVFHGSANGVTTTPVATIEGNQTEAWIGSAVASAGDVNGDGYSDLIVGGYAFDAGQTDEGVALVYHGAADVTGTTSAAMVPGHAYSVMGRALDAAGDLNGDGFGDVIVSKPGFDGDPANTGWVLVFYGSLTGLDTDSPVELVQEDQYYTYGMSISGAGDVNGDGYDDIIISAYTYFGSPGKAYVYYGSATGISQNSKSMLAGVTGDPIFGFKVDKAGDLNGDGFADVVIAATSYPGGDIQYGAAYVYYGSVDGLGATPKIFVGTVPGGEYAGGVCGVGDVNGDSYDDLLIASGVATESDSKVMIFHGSATGVDDTPAITLTGEPLNIRIGITTSSGGDINGDGYGDILIGSTPKTGGKGIALIYYGSSSGISSGNRTVLQINQNWGFGRAVSTAGDVNGDGYSDVLVGAPAYVPQNSPHSVGIAYLYRGTPAGIATTPDFSIVGMDEDEGLGSAVAGAGDVNGDGYGDVLVGAPAYNHSVFEPEAGYFKLLYGNNGKNLRNDARLYNADLTSFYNKNYPGQNTESNFGAGLFVKSFLGTNKGKLVWETRLAGNSFSKTGTAPITNSTQSTGSESVYQDLAATGTELKSLIAKLNPATNLRVRVKYDPALALTGQQYGPWRYLPAYLLGTAIAPPPQPETSEIFKALPAMRELEPVLTAYPNPATDKIMILNKGTATIKSVELTSPSGRTVRTTQAGQQELNIKGLPGGVYMLFIRQQDGKQNTQRVIVGQ
jgi:hypothetical protein